ncbi:MAG: hypothetical protein ACRETN_11620 [Nevskiales bacterium]
MAEHLKRGCVIGAEHPSLPGHFPGRPVVPGVVLLDTVRAAAEEAYGAQALAGLPQVKFLHPLLPQQSFDIRLSGVPPRISFECISGTQVLVKGIMEFVSA